MLGSPLPSPETGAALFFIGPPLLLIAAIGAFTSKERVHEMLALIGAAVVWVAYATR